MAEPKRKTFYPSGYGEANKCWVYLVGTKDGIIKVGVTQSPSNRLRIHRRFYGDSFAWSHLFGSGSRHMMFYIVEKSVLEDFRTAGIGLLKRGEEFRGITKQQAIAMVRVRIAEMRALVAGSNVRFLRAA